MLSFLCILIFPFPPELIQFLQGKFMWYYREYIEYSIKLMNWVIVNFLEKQDKDKVFWAPPADEHWT